jgi:orotate phosphoribosyltransferase
MTTMAISRGVAPRMHSTHERLLQILVETQSFKFSETPTFALASGVLSRYYVVCKVGLSYPEFRKIIGEMFLERVREPVHAVGGLEIGAYPIATAVSDAAYRRGGQVIRAFVVRKKPKPHGMQQTVDGDVAKGSNAVIVDDVITSGKSTIEAIEKSRAAGLVVTQAIAIIDREEQGGRQNIEALGVKFDALCTLRELQEATGTSPGVA